MVHPMCERSKLSSNDPTIKMPSIFGSISNVNNNNHNNNNSALMSDSPVASGAISKHNRPIRKSVNIQSPVKELDRKNEHPKTTTDKERQQKDNNNRQNTEVPIARPRIGIEKSLTAPTKGKKGPQLVAAISVSTGCLSYGICMAYTSSAIPSMLSPNVTSPL